MTHDLSAYQYLRLQGKFSDIPDRDALPMIAGLDWNQLADHMPVTTTQVLEALGYKKLPATFRKLYRDRLRARKAAASPIPRHQALFTPCFEKLGWLPRHSFALAFRFTLAQPMMTRDDNLFTVSDNTVRKDRAFAWPHLAASSWKGAFRNSLYHFGVDDPKKSREATIVRLFGTAGDEEANEGAQRGRLHFTASYFDRIDFQMLNPHDREKRSGKVPVEMELVPKGAVAWFHVLYVAGPTHRDVDVRAEAAEDWGVLAQLTRGVLLDFGFGAKVTLGFGTAVDQVSEGALRIVVGGGDPQRLSFRALSELPALMPACWKEARGA